MASSGGVVMWFQCGRDSWVREVAHSVGVPLLGGGMRM